MLEFIKLNLSSILVDLVFIIGLLFLYKRGKKELDRLIEDVVWYMKEYLSDDKDLL